MSKEMIMPKGGEVASVDLISRDNSEACVPSGGCIGIGCSCCALNSIDNYNLWKEQQKPEPVIIAPMLSLDASASSIRRAMNVMCNNAACKSKCEVCAFDNADNFMKFIKQVNEG